MRVRNALLPWRPSTSTDAARFELFLFSSSISIPPFLPLNRSSFEIQFHASFSLDLYNFSKAFSPPFLKKLCFFFLSGDFFLFWLLSTTLLLRGFFSWLLSDLVEYFSFFSILRSVLHLFYCFLFSQYSVFFQATTNCHSLFPFTNATRRPRYIVTIRTLICVSSRSAYSP